MTVMGWAEPERVAEYERLKAAAQSGAQVPWEERQAYMARVQQATRVLTRSLDAAQAGQPLGEDVHDAVTDVEEAVAVYETAVEDAHG